MWPYAGNVGDTVLIYYTVGGGFGGKEADGTMFALPLAVAANK